MNGAESVIRTLVAADVGVCFGNPGTSEIHLVAALDQEPKLRPVLCLHEGVATGAADGYGRMAERPAVTLLHLGAGLANGLANLHNARRARTKIVNLVGGHATFHDRYADSPVRSRLQREGFLCPCREFAKAAAVTAALFSMGAPAFAATQTETAKIFYQALSSNQPDLLDQVLAPDWEDVPLAPGQKPGRDGFKPLVSGFNKIFDGLKIANEDIIESGDKVVVRSTVEGTQAGEFAGFPSKGKPFKIMAIDIHQFKDGKVVKTWHLEDWLSGLFQMGAFEK